MSIAGAPVTRGEKPLQGFMTTLGRTNWERAKDRLSWQDFSGAHSVRQIGRTARWVPEFVNNDGQFKSVLVHATVAYIFRGGRLPDNIIADLEYLKAMADDRAADDRALVDGSANAHWAKMFEHVNAVENCGGYMQLTSAVMYRAWKLGWHSREIGDEMGMKQLAVTTILVKLVRIAEGLGYPTYPRRRDKPDKVRGVDEIIELWNAGETVTRIAKKLVCSQVKVRRVLKAWKLYTYKRQKPKKRGTNPAAKAYWEKQFLKTVAWG